MNFTEKLALVLINTQKEYLSGDTHRCLDAYFSNTPSIDKKIDLYIFFNKGEESEYLDLLEYKQHKNVNNVIIKSHRLSDFDDLYARTPKELKEMNLPKVPPLGGSAGPNNLFFNSMIPLTEKSYRDYLMVEPDTQPIQDNWIDKIIQFCDDEKFLVAGSMYRGKATLYTFAHWSGHLNGVAIYRNDLMLKVLFKYTKALIEKETELTDNTFLSFDVAMHQLRCTLSGQKHFNNRNLPENHLLDSPIISNYSLPQDTDVSVEDIKKEHPQTIILHKKPSLQDQQTLLPVYYHIAKNAGTYVLSATSFLLDQYLQSKNKQEDWCKVQAAIDFPSGNKCTAFIGLRHSGVNYWHDLKHHAKNAIANYTYLNSNLNGCSIDYLQELEYHAEIASQAYDQLDIGETYPNNFKSEFSDLEYARRLRDNALTALREKFPNSKTYDDYKENKKTILGQITINSLIKEFPEANTLDFCKKLHKEIIPSEISNITEQSFSPEEFISLIQNKEAFIFAVIIEPRNSGSSFTKSQLIGWNDNLEFIDKICELHNRKPINFLTLREPFSRANSLFYYLKSSDSDHEIVRDEVYSTTFEEYIDANELQDSWLIRQLLSLGWHESIKQTHYDLAIKKLQDFHIQDISSVDPLIEKVFLEAYNLSFSQVPKNYLNKNQSTKTNTLKFDQLSPDLQQKFLGRTRWDRKVYNHFIQ